MAKNFERIVSSTHFKAGQLVHETEQREPSLVANLRKVQQWIARDAVVAASITALTDSSGGTAGVLYKTSDSGVLSTNDITGDTTGVQASELDDTADEIMNAYAEIMDDVLDLFAEIDASSVPDLGPGGTPNNTIEIIDTTVLANVGNTDATTFLSGNSVRRDLLHAQSVVILAVDDAREAVGLARIQPAKKGLFVAGTAETLVFADDNPDTITRDVGSWVADGFLEGDLIGINGTDLNNAGENGVRIDTLTATVITLEAAETLAAESLDATETGLATVTTLRREALPGRIGGADTLDIDGTTTVAGNDWTFEFETGTSDISDAANGADATAAVLKTEVDALVAELADNIAFLADNIDLATQVSQSAINAYASPR